MLDFFAQHGIVSEIEMIPAQAINEAYERMLRSDVRYRFVIDRASLAPRRLSRVLPAVALVGEHRAHHPVEARQQRGGVRSRGPQSCEVKQTQRLDVDPDGVPTPQSPLARPVRQVTQAVGRIVERASIEESGQIDDTGRQGVDPRLVGFGSAHASGLKLGEETTQFGEGVGPVSLQGGVGEPFRLGQTPAARLRQLTREGGAHLDGPCLGHRATRCGFRSMSMSA